MISEHIVFSIKNLKTRGLRSCLTMLGIFIGIAAVVALISMGNALQQAITGQFATLDVDKLIIQNIGTGFGPPGSTVVKKLNKHDLELISSVSGVKEAIPRLLRTVKVEYNKIAQFKYAASTPSDKEQLKILYDSLNINAEKGRLLTETDKGKIILGNDFLDKSEFEKEIAIGTKIKIQNKEFEVIGILKKASTFQINSVILMLESDLKEILNIEDEIDLIIVQGDNQNKIKEISEDIEIKLRKDRKLKQGEEDFSVQTPTQTIETVNTILNVINIIISGIAAISLLVGGIGIANTMFTSVVERTREIGIMKAIGARNSDILKMFIIESAILGIIGGIIGVIIGLSLAFLVSNIASTALAISFQIEISLPLILLAISFSLIIGIISGIIPAIQASKLKPVEALRR